MTPADKTSFAVSQNHASVIGFFWKWRAADKEEHSLDPAGEREVELQPGRPLEEKNFFQSEHVKISLHLFF